MPLVVLPANEAVRRTRHAQSRWPRTEQAQAERLMPVARPGFHPSFHINRRDLIFTIGSCFARNIEKQLMLEGYNVAFSQFEAPRALGFRADPDALLNRYVVTSIANELRWALDPARPFKKRYCVETPHGWFDPHLHPAIRPSPLAQVQKRRKAVHNYMALAARARVFVMTLGLAEAWYDRSHGLYLNGVLPNAVLEAHPGRFEFHVLEYQQVLDALEEIRSLLKTFGRKDLRMLVTVSPVAMNTTFTGGEVLVANTYSKAVQRAAVEAFVTRHDDVDYFPSFESVMLSDRRRAWRDDQAHVSDEIVRLNVLRMIEAYQPEDEVGLKADLSAGVARAYELVQAAKAAFADGETEAAEGMFEEARRIAGRDMIVLMEFGDFLFQTGRYKEAELYVRKALQRGGASYGAHYKRAQILRAARRYEEAWAAAEAARALQPARPGLLSLSADIASRLGRHDEALELIRQAVILDPDNERRREQLEAIFRARKKANKRAEAPVEDEAGGLPGAGLAAPEPAS